MLMNWIRSQRRRMDLDLRTVSERRHVTPIFYAHFRVVLPILQRYIRGKTLDLGCGFMPFKAALIDQTTIYHGVDIQVQDRAVSFVGDIQGLTMLPDDAYDSALCIEVLEHVPEPLLALQESRRILRPGGVLVLTVPHLSRLHDIPHDYYRFTEFGLRYLLMRSNFDLLELQPKGGLFSFLGHQLSTLLLTLTWRVPLLHQLTWTINRWVVVAACYYLDSWLDANRIFAQGYVVVAQKPTSCEAESRSVAAPVVKPQIR